MENYILGGCLLAMVVIITLGAILFAVTEFKSTERTGKIVIIGMLAFLFFGDIFFVTIVLNTMKVPV